MLVDAVIILAWESEEKNNYDDFCDILPLLGEHMDDWDSDSRRIWVKTPTGIVRAEAGDVIVIHGDVANVFARLEKSRP